MEKVELEQKVEKLIRENWDREHLSSYDIWKSLRLVNEEFVFNLMKMREVLIEYHRYGQKGLVQYGWIHCNDEISPPMREMCDKIREVILDGFLHLRTLKDSDVWESLRNLERRWMVDELNDMTKVLEEYKQARHVDPTLFSQEEILNALNG
jgi:hypothetical protein